MCVPPDFPHGLASVSRLGGHPVEWSAKIFLETRQLREPWMNRDCESYDYVGVEREQAMENEQ